MSNTKYPFAIIEVFNDPTLGFRGNTAAIVQLETALPDEQMQAIASDLNQPATTFLWPSEHQHTWHVRWFAPDAEIGLCGHGSLAAFAYLPKNSEGINLLYRNGKISGNQLTDSKCYMQLAPISSEKSNIPEIVKEGLGKKVFGYYTNNNKHIVLLEDEESVKAMQPNFEKLRKSEVFGYIVTAPGNTVDFVSRTIVPHVQQLEDHATGSSHAVLTPFWANRLKKNKLKAWQLSKRGGLFECEYENDKVILTGSFKKLVIGKLDSYQ